MDGLKLQLSGITVESYKKCSYSQPNDVLLIALSKILCCTVNIYLLRIHIQQTYKTGALL